MSTFNIPAWTIPCHVIVPFTAYFIGTKTDWVDEEHHLSTKEVVMAIFRSVALGTLFSCAVAYATPSIHQTFSIFPSFLRESIIAIGYLASSTFGLFLYSQLEARLED